MADPPPYRLPASHQRHVTYSHPGLDEEDDPIWSEARSLDFQSDSEAALETKSEGSEPTMSPEELGEDDLLDSEEEYRREMEEQRIADEKNGHFREDRPSDLYRPARRETGQPARRSSRVSEKVAAFEAHLSSGVVADSDWEKRKKTKLDLQNDNLFQQGSHNINSICLNDAENGDGVAVHCGEREKLYTKNVATVPTPLVSNKNNGTCAINIPLAAISTNPKLRNDSFIAAPFFDTLQPSAQVKTLHLSGKRNDPCLGSGDISEALVKRDLGSMKHDESQINYPVCSTHVPASKTDDISNTMMWENNGKARMGGGSPHGLAPHVLDVIPISAVPHDVAADMEIHNSEAFRESLICGSGSHGKLILIFLLWMGTLLRQGG